MRTKKLPGRSAPTRRLSPRPADCPRIATPGVSWRRAAPFVALRLLVVGGLLPLACGTHAAEGAATSKETPKKPAAFGALLNTLADFPLPSLAGLIQPEKMGVLTDNQCRISDSEAHRLSDNRAGRDQLSGNSANLLSNLHLLSDIAVNVHVTIQHKHAAQGKTNADEQAAEGAEAGHTGDTPPARAQSARAPLPDARSESAAGPADVAPRQPGWIKNRYVTENRVAADRRVANQNATRRQAKDRKAADEKPNPTGKSPPKKSRQP